MRVPLRPAQTLEPNQLILLVEDNDELRPLIRDMMTAQGLQVIEAASVPEAMALISEVPGIAQVLSDIKLEGHETGLDLARRMASATLPCRLMTSLPPDDPLFAAATELGPVLAKPFGADELCAHLAGAPQ